MRMIKILGALAAALAIGSPALAQQAAYPTRPVKILVGFPPGNATDDGARRLAEALGSRLGQAFVVENRPGMGAGLAVEQTARAAPDGYTLLASSSGPLTINGWIYKSLRHDVKPDLEAIAPLALGSLALVVNAESPYRNLQDFVSAAKARPGVLNYGSGGNGVTNHLVMELFKDKAGIDIQHIPYKGGMAALTDVIGGQTAAMFEVNSVVEPLVRQGKLRVLAVSGSKRVDMFPDTPTLTEAGFPGIRGELWSGILAPKGTPPEILDLLHQEITRITQAPEWLQYLESRGTVPMPLSRQAFAERIATEIDIWGEAVKRAGVQPN